MSASESTEVNFIDTSSVITFIDGLEPRSEIKINSESEINGAVYLFFTKTKTNDVFLLAKDKTSGNPPKIKFNLDDLENNEYKIKSIQLNDKLVTASETESESKFVGAMESDSDKSNTQQDEDFEEEDEKTYVSKTTWELSYTDEELKESYINEVQNYAISEGESINIDSISREAESIINLINKYSSSDDIFEKNAIVYDDEYRPLYEKIKKHNYRNTYITPIVYDKKKFYNASISEEELKEIKSASKNIELVSQQKELEIYTALQEKMYKQHKPGVSELTYKDLLKLLHLGGTSNINLNPNETNQEEAVVHHSIHRTHISDSKDINNHYYSCKFKKHTEVYRNCFIDNCIDNPDIDDESNKIELTKRMVDGDLNLLEDIYDDIFNVDKNSMKTCNSHGDKLYSTSINDVDKNKTIMKSPYYNTHIHGEEVNIVGFYIKSPENNDVNIIIGEEDIIDNGSEKLYPKLCNTGLDVTKSKPNKKSKNVVIVSNYEDFSWQNFQKDTDYVVMINSESKKKLTEEDFNQVLEHITPNIREIMNIERESIEKVVNLIELSLIFNKHNLSVNQVPYYLLDEYNVQSSIVNNIINLAKHENYLKSNYIQSHNLFNKNVMIFNTILKFKLIGESRDKNINYQIPNEENNSSIKRYLRDKLETNLLQYDDKTLTEFINNFLKIETNDSFGRKECIDIIVNKFVHNHNFYSSKFRNYFIDKSQLIHPDYLDIFNDYIKEYNYDHEILNNAQITNFDKSVLQGMNLVSNIKKSDNGGRELLKIINISNMKYMEGIVDSLIDKRGKQEFLKSNPDLRWEVQEEAEKIKFLPDVKLIKRLNDEAFSILKIYNKERGISKNYKNNCQNIPIIKEYNSKRSLVNDNEKVTYYDSQYDTIKEDIKLYTATVKPNDITTLKEFREKMIKVHVFSSIDIVSKKIDNVIEFIDDESRTSESSMVKQGDLAVLNIENRKDLYRRQGNTWIPVMEKAAVTSCSKIENNILDMEFAEIKESCLNINAMGDDDCINDSNNSMSNKLFTLYKYHEMLIDDINQLIKLLEYKNKYYDYLRETKLELDENLKLIRPKNERKNKVLVRQDKVETTNNVYPTRSIQKKLEDILKIDDFDLRGHKLIEFIATYGSETRGGEFGKPYFIYYNIPSVNVPLICKHHTMLLTSVLKSNSVKEKVLSDVCNSYGVTSDAGIICKYCGETIDFHKYSEWEGFGRDNKVINVREKLDESVDQYDLSDEKHSEIINNILNLANISLRKDDFRLVFSLSEQISKNNLSFENFYFRVIKASDTKEASITKKSQYVKVEEWFSSKYNDYSFEFWSNIETNTEFLSDIKGNKNRTKYAEYFKKWLKIYNGYTICQNTISTISTLSEIIRTSIPEYAVRGTGTEKSAIKKGNMAGIVLKDIFNEKVTIQDKEIYWIHAYFIDLIWNQISQKTSHYWLWCNYYLKGVFKNPESSFKDENMNKLDEIEEIVVIKDRQHDKEIYNMNKLLENDSIKEYEWKEFLPPLDNKNNDFNYTPPNIKRLLNNYLDTKERLHHNNNEQKKSFSKYVNEQIRKDAIMLDEIRQELNEIEDKLSFSVMNKINNIILEEEIPENFSKSAYISSCCFDNIKNSYLNFCLEKDASIAREIEQLNLIRTFIAKNTSDNVVIFDLSVTTHDSRDLQHFMTFDESLYNSPEEIRKVLIEKLKLINYIYVIDNYGFDKKIDNTNNPLFVNNIGKQRYFKEITDTNIDILLNIYTGSDEESIEILSTNFDKSLGENYKFKDFKTKLINDYNGVADIDLITKEFRKDISKIIDKETKLLSDDEIKSIINDIELKANTKIESNNYSSQFHNKNNNLTMITDKLSETIDSHCCIFDSDILSSVKNELIDYQTKIENVNESNYKNYMDKVTQIISKYISLNDDELQEKISRITDIIVRNSRYNSTDVKKIFTQDSFTDLNSYIEEYKKDFSSNLEISGVPVENIPTEIKFRNSITENKRDNSVVHIHITYIRSLINVISLINNSKIDEDTGSKFDRQFNLNFLPKEDREKGIEIIESIKQIQTETTNIDFSLINSQIEKINSFLDNLTMYNSLHSSDGSIKQIFVNNPFSMEILTSSIIIYLYDVIIDSEVDEEPQTIQLVIKLFEYLLYIIDINSITDENIMTIIKKYRADENLNRLKRFNKKSDELQNTHKIKRKFNLGYLDDEDPEEEFNEIDFMTIEGESGEGQQVNIDENIDDMDMVTEVTWHDDDAGMTDFLEDREETE